MTKSVPAVQGKASDMAKVTHVLEIYRTIRTLIKGAVVVWCVKLGGEALAPFAGEQTIVSIALSFLADVKFVVSVTLALGAGAWAYLERRLRQKKTEYLQDRIKKLEQDIDPGRSSSGLTRAGKTNPRDRRK